MNTLILSSVLCLVFSALGVLGSAVTFSAGLSHVTGALASGEGEELQSSLGDEEELELEEDLSGGTPTDGSAQLLRHSKDQKEKGKSQKGKRNKGKKKKTTQISAAFNPEHTSSGHTSSGHTSSGHTSPGHTSPGHTSPGHTSPGHTSSGHTSSGHTSSGHTSSGHTSSGHTSSGHTSPGHTSPGHTSSGHTSSGHTSSGHTSPGHTSSGHTHQTSGRVTEDPCSSSHKGYCIHGLCKYMADLREPVCMCNKGYDGERCGILLLPTTNKEDNVRGEVVQTVLVVIAVVLSSFSCLAILLMACTHYRTHKNFLATYLGSGSEKQQLQKTIPCDITV
ncbi:amphiregulin isoform X2 [Salmo trutta]|uniref:Amphiregulin-like n=1 Tax=Salmo trutta TaxID=8032 RepID=A0A673X599_SALTR|nr:amphiregulin-like isoform X2 [Salmo trutta]